MDFSTAIAAFLSDEADRGLAPRTLATYERSLHAIAGLLKAQGCLAVEDVTPADVDALFAAATERGLARSTRKGWASVLRRLLASRAVCDLLPRNPARAIPLGADRVQDLPPDPLTEEEVERLFASLPRSSVLDLRNVCLLELLYGCGLRLSEALSLHVDDISIAERSLFVRHGKGGKDRHLPLLGGSLASLRAYLPLRRTLLRGPDTGELFLGRCGRPLTAVTVQQWVRGLGKVINRRLHPHLLRHSIAVHLLRGGADIRHVQEFLGHEDLDTTKIYLRLVPGHLKADYDQAMPSILQKGAL